MLPEKIIFEFLELINQSSNEEKQRAIREFDEYFFVINPKLTEDAILRLFLGDSWKTRGILHFIGGQIGCGAPIGQLEESKGEI
jgi:hypothetical protein